MGTELPMFVMVETNPKKHGLFRSLNLQSSIAASKNILNHETVLEPTSLIKVDDNVINNWDKMTIISSTYKTCTSQ